MGFVKNYSHLIKTPERKVVLDLVEAALASIQPGAELKLKMTYGNDSLTIDDERFDLSEFHNVYVVGFGKGAASNVKIIEDILGDRLTAGWVIDTEGEKFKKVHFVKGTHPLPSAANVEFTKKVVEGLTGLLPTDLVLIVTCGGGSVMFALPHELTLDQIIDVNKALLKSGANISEMNAVRKHLDVVKGGGLAKILFPAKVANLVFSDVPGNDLSVIASGPTVLDPTTTTDALSILEKRNIKEELSFIVDKFVETPKEERFFDSVKNILIVSNQTALDAMSKKAESMGYSVGTLSASFSGNANEAGADLVAAAVDEDIILCGGETEVKVTGSGVGGRNQQLVLAALPSLPPNTIICSFNTDGWDNSPACGAIGDAVTIATAEQQNLNIEEYLKNDDSFTFFEKVGDAILTDRLPSNVADLMIVFRK